MKFPENLLYTRDHEWIKFVDDVAFVGVTDFAQKELGDIVYVEIETIGQTIDQNNVFGTIEAVKTVSDLFIPIKGEILELNQEVADSPEFVNSDPYEKGWLVKIKPNDVNDRSHLMTAEEYKIHIGVQ